MALLNPLSEDTFIPNVDAGGTSSETLVEAFREAGNVSQEVLPLPSTPGNGVLIDLFNGIGGGAAPTPDNLVDLIPSGSTLSPFIDFPNPGLIINVGNSFNTFFANTTTPPDQVTGLAASNFILRSNFFLRVEAEMDQDLNTPEIDFQIGVGSDDGFYLTVNSQFIGSGGDRPFTDSTFNLSLAEEGLYPVELLFAANSVGQSGLELFWRTALTGGARQIIPQDFLYLSEFSGEQVIEFEEAILDQGDEITDQFQDLGILFNTLGGNLQVTNAFPDDFVPVTAPFVYADPGASPTDLGELELSFVVPETSIPAVTDFVSFFLIDAETTGATVTAFDSSDEILFSQTFNEGGATQTLVTIEQPDIARVRISLGQGNDTTAIDNIAFTIPVAINRAPTDIALSNATIAEDASFDTVIGLFSAVDPDFGDQVTFELVDDAGGQFIISGNELLLAVERSLDFETTPSYEIEVQAIDNGELTFNERFTITVQDVPEVDLNATALNGVPTTANFGDTIEVSYTVENLGPNTAGLPWSDRFFLSTDGVLDTDDIELRTVAATTVPLAAGESYSATVSLELPTDLSLDEGNYSILVQADASDQYEESDEANNVIGSNISLQANFADLTTWEQQGPLGAGNWSITGDRNQLVQQFINGEPTFFVSPFNFINGTVTGTFSVQTTGDDDFIGFCLWLSKSFK